MGRQSLVNVVGPRQITILSINAWLLAVAITIYLTGAIHAEAVAVGALLSVALIVSFYSGSRYGRRATKL